MDARNRPTVRRGMRHFRGTWGYLVLILGAIGCFAGAGFSLWAGEWMVKDFRHEYRYEGEEPPR